jgi:hypothetical protein
MRLRTAFISQETSTCRLQHQHLPVTLDFVGNIADTGLFIFADQDPRTSAETTSQHLHSATDMVAIYVRPRSVFPDHLQPCSPLSHLQLTEGKAHIATIIIAATHHRYYSSSLLLIIATNRYDSSLYIATTNRYNCSLLLNIATTHRYRPSHYCYCTAAC